MTFPVFVSGEVLRAQDMNAVGLWLVKSQAVGTGVSSVTVTGAFSADYDNYRILWTGGTSSSATSLKTVLGSANTGYYHWMTYGAYNTGAAAPNASGQNNVSQFSWVGGGDSNGAISDFELFDPFETKNTFMKAMGFYASFANAGFNAGVLKTSTSYSAFTLSADAGTMTGGTIRVYGYRN